MDKGEGARMPHLAVTDEYDTTYERFARTEDAADVLRDLIAFAGSVRRVTINGNLHDERAHPVIIPRVSVAAMLAEFDREAQAEMLRELDEMGGLNVWTRAAGELRIAHLRGVDGGTDYLY